MTSAIPAVAHFVWFGAELPWLHTIALQSAARHGGFARIVLHHDAELASLSTAYPLHTLRGFEPRRIDPDRILAAASPQWPELRALYDRLQPLAARANLLRVAILAAEGGVYLDMDTVTLASFQPLLAASAFCGHERVAFPAHVVHGDAATRAGGSRLRAHALNAARDLLRRLPEGQRHFRAIERWFELAPNNAVLGAHSGHPLLHALLRAMLTMEPERQLERYALGTHLLQQHVHAFTPEQLTLHPPETFYPLGPEISEHWFRLRARPDLSGVLAPSTRLVHWYASVRTRQLVPKLDAAYVRAHASRQLLSALIAPYA